MPVTDLRYILGVPTEAPANPGFQRTRQLAGQPVSPYQSAIDFENAASSVQANRGLAYLQGIQNHQNEIAQQAQNLRIQQEAQLAAEQATQGLAGIQPDQPEYLNQRQQILQQNPNALMNEQFRNTLGIYDQGYQRVAQQRGLEAKQVQAQQKQVNGLGLRAIEYGGSPEEVAGYVESGNVGALAQMIGNLRQASKAKPKSGAEPTDYRTKAAYGKYLDAVAEGNTEAATEIDKFARQGGFHWETPVAPTVGATTPPTPSATQTGSQLREVLGGRGGPMASPEEIKSHFDSMIGSKNADENFYSDYIANPNIPLRDKEAALEKFREFSANPPVDQSLTLPQVFARKEEIKKKLSEAEEEVKFQPEREKFNRAWDASKAGVDGIVERTAKKLGVSKQNLINSLVAGDKIDIPGRDRDRGGISIPQLLAEQWKEELPDEFDQPHQIWSTEARPLTPFKNSPFASKLGTKVGPIPIRQTWGDVLDAYVQDHKNPSASNQPVQNLPRPSSPEEAAKLPAGTQFIGPDGTIRIVPQK